MGEKVKKCGVKREDGFLYYIDKQGDVSKASMARGGKKGGKPKKVLFSYKIFYPLQRP